MIRRLCAILPLLALLGSLGCFRSKPHYQASVDVSLSSDCVGSNTLPLNAVQRSDELAEKLADDLKLAQKWSSPGSTISRADAVTRLKNAVRIVPDVGGFILTVNGLDAEDCQTVAEGMAAGFKARVEEAARKQIEAKIALDQKQLQIAQDRLTELRKQLVESQKGEFVPSQFRLTPQYEAEMQDKIKAAQAEENERSSQLDALRTLQGAPLKDAMLKIERSRLASPDVATNPAAATSALLNANQAVKAAQGELELAQSGAVSETNAVGHAQLKLEQASTNLVNTVDAYLKSLEIELDVAKARRQELETQLGKLREANKQAEAKSVIEKDVGTLNVRLNALDAEIEQWKLCQRILPDAIRLGPVRVDQLPDR